MGSEGSRLAESERGVWFWLKRYSICTPHFYRKNELILFRGRKTDSAPKFWSPQLGTEPPAHEHRVHQGRLEVLRARLGSQVSTRISGRRTAPFTPFLISNRVPHGSTQDPSTYLDVQRVVAPVDELGEVGLRGLRE